MASAVVEVFCIGRHSLHGILLLSCKEWHPGHTLQLLPDLAYLANGAIQRIQLYLPLQRLLSMPLYGRSLLI